MARFKARAEQLLNAGGGAGGVGGTLTITPTTTADTAGTRAKPE